MNFEQLGKEYASKYNAYRAEQHKIKSRITQRKAQISRLENKLAKTYSKCPSWIDEILKPIAEAMLEKMTGRYYDILGPFGMTAETSIHFYKMGVERNRLFDGDNCRSITFRPTDLDKGRLSLVDYTKNTGQFAKGTMGEMNGMNYPEIPMKKTIDELLDYMNRQRKAKVA